MSKPFRLNHKGHEEHEAKKTYLRELRALRGEKSFLNSYAACFWTRGSFDASIL